ncbi:hypothetical protein [Oscillatoria sp. FACHB-1406]|uniref:hypothetical protein n=1 Tax=Oscillatoria sp. FACHB-1406 TaxID=2692846 RepID=UPI001681C9C0|nr:hypothetical protein [Oscillatoria sp. FACHB-1406]MBD2579354.1 hypothetical protein [Oscillatoria sp. FACHB-1406]
MYNSDEYKRQIMNDLARGNVESLGDTTERTPEQEYENFDDFAQRSSRSERRSLFGRLMHHDSVPPAQMAPELQRAIAQIKPNERDDVAREFFKQLKQRGLSDRQLEQQLGLSTHNPNHMTENDLSLLANFVYNSHPDIFQEVMADQPALLKFLSNPVLGALLGVAASKWLGRK